jgi:hypothetical protein
MSGDVLDHKAAARAKGFFVPTSTDDNYVSSNETTGFMDFEK